MEKDMSVGQTVHEGKKNKFTIGTWNVRGTYAAGGLKQLVREMECYKLDIIAVQETKQRGTGIAEVEKTIFFKSGGRDRMLGTGFLVGDRLKRKVINFNPITERLCSIRLKGEKRNISIINVHAPSVEKEDDEKERYYELLENECDKLPKFDAKIVIGDCNAKVGKEDVYRRVAGQRSKHEVSNDNGQRLINFAMERDMDIYKGTWKSPDGRVVNQIDHVLIERKHENKISNVRSTRGAEADSDHFLVKVTTKNLMETREIGNSQRIKEN
ncbi:hypothetical protein RI129_011963 [Pyrocoelia pectoralis]|uniref:Endonuclease/exonuclease/phosphatase domain-containing protein n=1 Tax=Pyrocoelia pectoralis TaxID=417401 RepID=A0AAN7ZGB4_9COLE